MRTTLRFPRARAGGAGRIIGFGHSDTAEARLIAAQSDEAGMSVSAETRRRGP